jgi:hypothetical protein
MIELNNIFNITYGTNKELCYLNQSDDGINFVSRTSKNNGVSAKVELIENILTLFIMIRCIIVQWLI